MKPLPFILIVLVVASGCHKSDSTPADVFPPGVNIYMAGQYNGHVAYWKNGKPVDLGLPGYATGIAVSDTNIYVCANTFSGQIPIAAYWKNSTCIKLSDERFANANGIAVTGEDVYIIGLTVGVPDDTIVYWKNNQEYPLTTDRYTTLYGIAASGSDVYMTGSAAYHIKNGGPAILSSSTGRDCNAVAIAGQDLYFAGDSLRQPYYWKNDRSFKLPCDSFPPYQTTPLTMTVSATDVYITGMMPDAAGNTHPVYWKNGVLTRLATQQHTTSTLGDAIAVAGKDIYIAGSINEGGNSVPVYWKNGQMVRLGTQGYVKAITLK